ncbi:MAG: sulfotransferase family 2 domain-containing protein [Pseudomonadota bacterium]
MKCAPPLIISHIPKTAGTSLRKLVEELNQDSIFVYDGQLALANPNINFIDNFRNQKPPSVMMGHFSYGVHRLLGVEPNYASMFRDPIERIVSLYVHFKTRKDSPFYNLLAAGMTLADFISSEITEQTNNHMCRIVAGIAPDAGKVITSRWLLDLALHNLDRHYIAYGIAEQYEKMIAKVAYALDWNEYEIFRENVGERPQFVLDTQAIEVISKYNQLDMELFSYIKSKCV